jgi:hypothetical protein
MLEMKNFNQGERNKKVKIEELENKIRSKKDFEYILR